MRLCGNSTTLQPKKKGSYMYRLSVCAGTVLQDLPFMQRVQEIARAGFLVDFWGIDADAVDAIAANPDIQVGAIPGWVGGSMVDPGGVDDYVKGVKQQLELAGRLGCKNLGICAGTMNEKGQVVHAIADHPASLWISAYKVLCQVAELAEKHDVTFHLEQLNTKVDHARYPFPHTEDVVRLVDEVGSPRIRLLCDVYHVQIEEGNVIESIRNYYAYIGNMHVADVPGRHEPGTGEINYPAIANVLRELDYNGVVGLEAFPKADGATAMAQFREIFS